MNEQFSQQRSEIASGRTELSAVLKSQYYAALAMLREAVERCPDEVWYSKKHVNSFWQIAYHALFFTHLYLQPNEAAFRPWERHQGDVQHPDGIAGPSDPRSTLPLIPEPYTKADVLAYWSFCEQMVDGAVDELDLSSPESGFSWYKVPKLEHQIVNIRHIEHHTAQLADRLRAEADVGIRWVGSTPTPHMTSNMNGVDIRDEQPGDYGAIREVHRGAFGGETEANLVEILRNRKKAPIALVAVNGDRILGHIMFSPVTVAQAPGSFRGMGLAPVGVLPAFQNKGIGSRLIEAGLQACRESGYDAVVVLGESKYYSRFGFSRARDRGLDNEYNADEAFMVLELRDGTLKNVSGLVKYVSEFGEVGS